MTGARGKAVLLEALLEALLLVSMVAAAITLVVIPLLGAGGAGWVGGETFGRSLSVEAELCDPVPGLPGLMGTYDRGEAVELSGPATVQATVFGPSWTQRLGLLGSTVLTGLVVLGVMWLLLRITRTLRQGDVFVIANARRLQLIAVLVGVGGMAAQGLHLLGRAAVLDAETVRERVLLTFEISLLPVMAAVGIAVAAEVFRQGAALRDDVEGLV